MIETKLQPLGKALEREVPTIYQNNYGVRAHKVRLLVGIAGHHGGLRIANPKVEGRVKVEGLGFCFGCISWVGCRHVRTENTFQKLKFSPAAPMKF